MLRHTTSFAFSLLFFLQGCCINAGSMTPFKLEVQLESPEDVEPDGDGGGHMGRGLHLLHKIQRFSPEAALIIDVLDAIGRGGEDSLGRQFGTLPESRKKTKNAFSSGPFSTKIPSLTRGSSTNNVLGKRTNDKGSLSPQDQELSNKINRNTSPSIITEGSARPVAVMDAIEKKDSRPQPRIFFFDSFESWLDEFIAGLKRDTILNVGKVGGIVLLYYLFPDVLEWIDQNLGLD